MNCTETQGANYFPQDNSCSIGNVNKTTGVMPHEWLLLVILLNTGNVNDPRVPDRAQTTAKNSNEIHI